MTILTFTKCLQILLKDSILSVISIAKEIAIVGSLDDAENENLHFFIVHPTSQLVSALALPSMRSHKARRLTIFLVPTSLKSNTHHHVLYLVVVPHRINTTLTVICRSFVVVPHFNLLSSFIVRLWFLLATIQH